jgi:uncharacterized protein YndB with AHSA1/START domain
MIDIPQQLAAIHREVARKESPDGELIAAVMRRRYDTAPQDVWSAFTEPERLRRWFLPISGDLTVGGSFQLEGNAGGVIQRCDPPKLLRVTFGGEVSIVELRLVADGEGTVLELEHTVPAAMAGSGAGALYVGPGWDGAFVALGLYLEGIEADDPAAAANSPEGRELSRQSVERWIETVRESGTATPEQLDEAVQVAKAQFAPDD